MIAVLDYGLGNSQAFVTYFDRMGFAARRVRSSEGLEGATKLVLPGVGAFDHALELFSSSGLRPEVELLVTQDRLPLLGVCVGMQILAGRSEEGEQDGLGWIDGEVRALSGDFRAPGERPTPHMGWNSVRPSSSSGLFGNLVDDARFYFLHSYYFHCSNPAEVVATVNYGAEFTCAIQRDNIYGVQFHPEKSHKWGGQLLRNFASL